jgi:hypothetical protein
MKIYIAGPMRGKPLYNFPAFREAAKVLRAEGWVVFSPAEIDNEEGFDEGTVESSLTKTQLIGFLMRDIEIVTTVDAICMLPGYENSYGASVELAMALFLGLPVYFIDAKGKVTR